MGSSSLTSLALVISVFQACYSAETLASNGSIYDSIEYITNANPPSTLSRQLRPTEIDDLLTCLNQSTATPESVEYLKTDEWLRRRGYSVNSHTVITEDGYILKVFRVFGSLKNPGNGTQKPVILFNHGLSGSSNGWLIQEGPNNLVQVLVDAGYEVWLGNARGNSYSNKHIHLSEDDLAFWDFSWHEMGVYDVPAVIDKILRVTGLPNIYYLGHSMGTTQYVVMLSERPEYNAKIKKGFLLAPAVIINNATSPIRAASILSLNINGLYLTDPLLGGRIKTNSALEEFFGVNAGEVCAASKFTDCELCSNAMFFLFGFNSKEMNYTALPSLYTNYPDVIGTKCIVHYAQIMNDPRGRFKRFDYGLLKNYRKYGTFSPPEYNLRNVEVPTYMYYGRGDNLCPKKNVEEFSKKLKKSTVKQMNLIDARNKKSKFNHMDFIAGKSDYKFYGKSVLTTLLADTDN